MRRRTFVLSTLAVGAAPPPARARDASIFARDIAAIEARTGGRLGVAIIDNATLPTNEYRGHERFPMCSTFKLLAVATVLARIDRGSERASRHIAYGPADLLGYAPVTRAHVARGCMTVDALCEATMTYSDNTAANLLLRTLGGPAAVTRFARTLGDRFTRLDRNEPALNTAVPGDPRDTTTPLAMAHSLRAVALGGALSGASRTRLVTWLRGNRTGDGRLRAGIPPSWRVGDKTGTGGEQNHAGASGTRNDIAVIWPLHRAPLAATVYLTGATIAAAPADAAIADVARLIVSRLSHY